MLLKHDFLSKITLIFIKHSQVKINLFVKISLVLKNLA